MHFYELFLRKQFYLIIHYSLKQNTMNSITHRLYTTIPLASWLLSKKITCLGTLQNNKPGIPTELKDTKNRTPFSYQVYWEKSKGNLQIHSYHVRSKAGKGKNVNLLSTFDTHLGTTIDDGKMKPASLKLYDYTKGVVT